MKFNIWTAVLAVMLASSSSGNAQADPPTKIAPCPPGERLVGMAYSTWFPPVRWSRTWGTPLLGTYRSDDPKVIRQHANWLCEAGVDFIWVDWSNNTDHDPTMKNTEPIFRNGERWLAYREGIAQIETATEKVFEVFSTLEQHSKVSIFLGLPNGDKRAVTDGRLQKKADQVHQHFVSHPVYGPLLQRYLGKPLLAIYAGTPSRFPRGLPPWDDPRFTVRWFTGFVTEQPNLRSGRLSKFGYWSWEDRGPATYSVHDGQVEAMVITAASRAQAQPDQPEKWIPAKGRRNGATFREAWKEARHFGPKFAMVVAWNEFSLREGKSAELSKDIEPSKEYGYNYLKLLKEEIARFKSGEPAE